MMETQAIHRTEHLRVARTDTEDTMRRLIAESDVTRLTVSDMGGHHLVEIPVQHDIAPLLMDVAVPAAGAVAERVGDVMVEVERQPGLTSSAGEAVRPSMGAEPQQPSGQAQGASDQQPANVTAEDVRRIAEANAVPTGSRDAVERIEPEQRGDPDLKDAGTPYSPSEPGRKGGKPSR